MEKKHKITEAPVVQGGVAMIQRGVAMVQMGGESGTGVKQSMSTQTRHGNDLL